MGFSRPTLTELIDLIYNDYISRYQPVAPSVRYDLIRVLTSVDAGVYHHLYGDLVFLARQIFPDTAEGAYLRAHWSDRVPPLNGNRAIGTVEFSGPDGATLPAGLLLEAPNGQTWFTDAQVVIADGVAHAYAKASEFGSAGNCDPGTVLTIQSAIPSGVSSTATVLDPGIAGGVDGESDAEYLARVLLYLQTGARYGKPGDFAAWAIDSSAEVNRAWESTNWSVFGALLIQCVQGNQVDGVSQVANLTLVSDYIADVAPPTIFAVRTPDIVTFDPTISLLPAEDTTQNRELVTDRIKEWMDIAVQPGSSITGGDLQEAIVDGSDITSAEVELAVDPLEPDLLELLMLGVITWG